MIFYVILKNLVNIFWCNFSFLVILIRIHMDIFGILDPHENLSGSKTLGQCTTFLL